jgi:hypothetical protein
MAHAAELPGFPEENAPSSTTAPSSVKVQTYPRPSGSEPVPFDEIEIAALAEMSEELGDIEDDSDEELGGENSLYADSTFFRPSPLDSFYEGLSKAVDLCAPYVQTTSRSVRDFGQKIKTLKEEKPLQFLGVIAGSAFALGMVVRFTRSSHE